MTNNKFAFKSVFDNRDDTKRLIQRFFDQRGYIISIPEDYYNLIEHAQKDNTYVENILYLNNKPAGMYFAELQSKDMASLYATITDREIDNHATDTMIFYLLHALKSAGVQFLNLGGSESKTLDEYKLKFKPVKQIKKYWVTLPQKH